MKFTDYLFEESKEIWEAYLQHPFIKEIGEGTLPKEKFLNYLIQDYLYLKEYSKVFCMGVVKSETMEEMRFFYKSIEGTMEDETAVHIKYMNELGVSSQDAESYPLDLTTTSYTSYMKSEALSGGLKEIAMAVLPCTWSYSFIGKYLENHYKDNLDNNYYTEWIKMYSDDSFTEFTDRWIKYTDNLCKDINNTEKVKLKDIFVNSSLYEMDFWDMAYEEVLKEELV